MSGSNSLVDEGPKRWFAEPVCLLGSEQPVGEAEQLLVKQSSFLRRPEMVFLLLTLLTWSTRGNNITVTNKE